MTVERYENKSQFSTDNLTTKRVEMIDTAAVARRFDKHAATYDSFATIQNSMASRCIATLQKLCAINSFTPEMILELGCGTGQLTSLLCTMFPSSNITAIDIAPAMIDIASSKNLHNVEFEVSSIEDFTSPHKYDLIVSNATIQWLRDPTEALTAVHAFLSDQSISLHLTFGPKTFQEIDFCTRSVRESQRSSFSNDGVQSINCQDKSLSQRAITAKSALLWQKVLINSALHYIDIDSFIHEVSYPNAYSLFRSINKTGASYTTAERLPPSTLTKVIQLYDKLYKTELGVMASYEIVKIIGSNYYKNLSID